MVGKECNGLDHLRSGHSLSNSNKVVRVTATSQRTMEQKRNKLVPSNRCLVKTYLIFMMGETELVWGQHECMPSLATFSNPQMGQNRKGRWQTGKMVGHLQGKWGERPIGKGS